MKRSWLFAVAPALLLLTACNFEPPHDPGPPHTDSIHIPRGTADHVNLQLELGAGQLTLHGSADDLIDGTFEYSSALKPLIESHITSSHAAITIRQAGHGAWSGNAHNTWDLKLSNQPLVDLVLNCGAGQANLSLGDLKLRSIEVHMGAGQVDLDLRGKPTRDYDVRISGGVGQATIQLPQGVGIRADAHGGLGSIEVNGLEKRDDHYENDLYDKANVNVRLHVEGGIGQIRITA